MTPRHLPAFSSARPRPAAALWSSALAALAALTGLYPSAARAETSPDARREFAVSPRYIFNIESEREDTNFAGLALLWGRYDRPRREWLLELNVLQGTSPKPSQTLGVSGLLRYDLLPRRPARSVTPFCQAGLGVLGTNLRYFEFVGGFQFQEQAGLGLRWRLNDRDSLLTTASVYHVSNAGTHPPNIGIDAAMYSVGFARRY